MQKFVPIRPAAPNRGQKPLHYLARYQSNRTRIMIWLFFLVAAFQALFASAPWIDVWISSLFWEPAKGFAAARSPVLTVFREAAQKTYFYMAILALCGVLAGSITSTYTGVPRRVWGFIFCLYLIGPALLVNGLLKSFWGRARPADIMEFGGNLSFSPPFEIAAQCQVNCSFVSGEAAGAAAFAISAYVLTRFLRNKALRRIVFGSALTVSVLGALLRTVFGRHFLSDVIFAILLVSLVAVLLSFMFLEHRGRGRTRLKRLGQG